MQKRPTRNKSEEIRIAESILVILKRFVYNICAEWGKPAFAAKLNKRFFLKKILIERKRRTLLRKHEILIIFEQNWKSSRLCSISADVLISEKKDFPTRS